MTAWESRFSVFAFGGALRPRYSPEDASFARMKRDRAEIHCGAEANRYAKTITDVNMRTSENVFEHEHRELLTYSCASFSVDSIKSNECLRLSRVQKVPTFLYVNMSLPRSYSLWDLQERSTAETPTSGTLSNATTNSGCS